MRALIIHVYEWLLRLYPRRFHQTFADEMRDVFAQAVYNAEPLRLAVIC
jgi:hypothetical protein